MIKTRFFRIVTDLIEFLFVLGSRCCHFDDGVERCSPSDMETNEKKRAYSTMVYVLIEIKIFQIQLSQVNLHLFLGNMRNFIFN